MRWLCCWRPRVEGGEREGLRDSRVPVECASLAPSSLRLEQAAPSPSVTFRRDPSYITESTPAPLTATTHLSTSPSVPGSLAAHHRAHLVLQAPADLSAVDLELANSRCSPISLQDSATPTHLEATSPATPEEATSPASPEPPPGDATSQTSPQTIAAPVSLEEATSPTGPQDTLRDSTSPTMPRLPHPRDSSQSQDSTTLTGTGDATQRGSPSSPAPVATTFLAVHQPPSESSSTWDSASQAASPRPPVPKVATCTPLPPACRPSPAKPPRLAPGGEAAPGWAGKHGPEGNISGEEQETDHFQEDDLPPGGHTSPGQATQLPPATISTEATATEAPSTDGAPAASKDPAASVTCEERSFGRTRASSPYNFTTSNPSPSPSPPRGLSHIIARINAGQGFSPAQVADGEE